MPEAVNLSKHAFLAGADPALIKLMESHARPVVIPAGTFIYREGETSDDFYLIESGRIAVEINAGGGGAMTIETLHDGDILGWSWVVPPYRKSFDARAVEETRAIAVNAPKIRALMEGNRELGYELLKRIITVVAKRLQSTRLQVLDVYGLH